MLYRKMKRVQLDFKKSFRVIRGNARAQAAQMVVAPGKAEGDPRNRHRGADQWLYVVSGQGVAVVNGKRYGLRSGTLMLIEHGDKHEIRNAGRAPLRTVNFYVPPGYTKDGEELPRGRA